MCQATDPVADMHHTFSVQHVTNKKNSVNKRFPDRYTIFSIPFTDILLISIWTIHYSFIPP